MAEPGAKRQQFRGVLIISTYKELAENTEAHQRSWRRSRPVTLPINLS